jgi:hypothetical protein
MTVFARRLLFMILVALLTTALAAPPAAAATGDVVIGGILVLRVRTAAGGLTAADRAVIIEQRIVDALSSAPVNAEAVTVRQVAGQPAIFVGPVMIITVDANHARLNGTTPLLLAELWVRSLREALPRALPLRQPVV